MVSNDHAADVIHHQTHVVDPLLNIHLDMLMNVFHALLDG